MSDFATLQDAARRLKPEIAIVLGSGLADALPAYQVDTQVAFADLPGMAAPTVIGHGGSMAIGRFEDRPVLLYRGRLHFYEGHSWERVARPIHLAAELGIRQILLTNAAGGIRADLMPGTAMVIADHFRWNRPWSWREPGPGQRPSVYSPRLRQLFTAIGVAEGIYGSVSGPTYETPAEVRALRAAGADAVGMSTAHEAEVAYALGLEVAGLSGITNQACGLGEGPLHHGEVLTTAADMAGRMARVLEHFLRSA